MSAQPNKNQSLKAGYICLAIAVVPILIGGPFGWFLAGPLALVAFILAIVGLTKGNTTGGIILLISSIVAPLMAQLIWIIVLGGALAASSASLMSGAGH